MQLVMCRIPAPVQHPTLLSQSLSGPLEAAAPFLHDAASLPHAQVVLPSGSSCYCIAEFRAVTPIYMCTVEITAEMRVTLSLWWVMNTVTAHHGNIVFAGWAGPRL